jgi:hypothetical protein
MVLFSNQRRVVMSLKLIYGEEQRLLPWACERSGSFGYKKDAYAMGLEQDGELRVVLVYDTFSAADCHMHIASDDSATWMVRASPAIAFAYPFIQLKLRRVTAPIPATNAHTIAFAKKLGFEEEGICKHALPNDDVVILGMIRENCRFIDKEHRK